MRGPRAIRCDLPPTLRYLPKHSSHPHAMIAAFGTTTEPEPGTMLLDHGAVDAVHLTRLQPDGSDKAEMPEGQPAKIMFGSPRGRPIMLSSFDDGLGLAITEGIEDALSIRQCWGIACWAAGSATHLAKLGDAVPSWTDCVTIFEDDNEAGHRAVGALTQSLNQRGIAVEVRNIARALQSRASTKTAVSS